MTNINLRIAAALFAAAFLIGSVCSCSTTENDGTISPTPSSVVAETQDPEPSFQERSFDGAAFVICSPVEGTYDYSDNYIDNEDYNGEMINDAVVSRNIAVEDKYDVEIIHRNQGTGYASRATRSDTVDFDLVYDMGVRMVSSAAEGIYVDLKSLKFIDLTQSYWAPSTQDSLTVADKLIIATCDVSMNRLDYTQVYLFNKKLLDESGIASPYQFIENDQWAFDTLIKLFTESGKDVDDDGLWTKEDIYGTDAFDISDVLQGCGVFKELTQKNNDGSYTLNVYSEKLTRVYNKYIDYTLNSFIAPTYVDWTKGKDLSAYKSPETAAEVLMFTADHVVFHQTTMKRVRDIISSANKDSSFGIMPVPKYDPSQKEYCHSIDPRAPMFAVPVKAPDLRRTATILEYLAYESSQRLYDAYCGETVRADCMSDDSRNAEKTLEIVKNSSYYCWTSLYRRAIFDSNRASWDPCTKMLEAMLESGNFSSVQKEFGSEAQKSIDNCYELFKRLNLE